MVNQKKWEGMSGVSDVHMSVEVKSSQNRKEKETLKIHMKKIK
jgi:hypothetical protein